MNKEISKIIKEWKDEAGLTHNDIILISECPGLRKILTIYTSKPCCMIGKGGELLTKYEEKLKELLPNLEYVTFVGTDYWYIR